jgi:hypothetical protein
LYIRYNTSVVELEDMPIDIGYASERVELKNSSDESFSIGGQNGFTQLIISTPFIEKSLLDQLVEFDSLLTINALNGMTKALVVADKIELSPIMEEWLIGYDYDEAFGDYYGVRLSNKKLAKSLFIISKDGALFYHEILDDVNAPFSIDKALVKIAAANNCYTGKGCH